MLSFSWSDLSLSTVITSLVSSGVTAALMVKWIGSHVADRWMARYKSDLDKEFEDYRYVLERKRKRLEAQLSHSVYTTQSQFDAEFNAIKSIFAALGKLRLSFNGMRPEFTWGPTDEEAKTKQLLLRLSEFKDRYNALVDTAESSYPFVPEDLYEHVSECMKTAMIEMAHVETAGEGTFKMDWYEDGAKQRDRFNAAFYKAAKLARERFRSLSVVFQQHS
jgi:hypothetical protein